MKKYLLTAIAGLAALFALTSSVSAALHVGVGANFDRCTTNSGTIAISYDECIGLAWLYQETNGDNRGQHGGRFVDTGFQMRNGRDGNNLVNWQVFGGSEANLDGGHINEIYLMNNNLSGTIMTGLLYLPYVTVWGLGGNSISAVNTEALTGVSVLNLGSNRLTSLTLPVNPSMTSINIGNNFLSGFVSFTGQTGLQSIDISRNEFTGFTVGNNTGLTVLNISANNFPSVIDFSIYRNLNELYTSGNSFTSLDISNNTGLRVLNVQNNPFTSLTFNGYALYSGLLIGNGHFDGMTYIPTDLNTLQFLRTYDPNWGRKGFGGGQIKVTPKDNCPDGDTSPTEYDSLCSGMSVGSSDSVLAVTTGATSSSTADSSLSNMGIDTTGSIVATGTDEMPVRRSDEDPCTDAEIESAYVFAHEHGLSTMPTCMTARTEDFLTRGEAAKMISNYAMNVMEMSPDADMKCMFSDMTSVGSEMQGYAKTACQLGLMGLKGDGTAAATFNPTGLIDKAQFATILSRMLWGDENNTTDACRYCKHVDALKATGVIKVTTDLMNPLKRGRAMLMLMRLDQ